MQIHPQVVQAEGIISVTMLAEFIGDSTDTTDKQRILAYGDPQVNLAGQFTDPANQGFTFRFPASEVYVGITTQMSGFTARFMENPPAAQPQQGWPGQQGEGWSAGQQSWQPGNAYEPMPNQLTPGSLDCVTSNPVEAATVWAAAIQTAVLSAMTALRAQNPVQLTSLPNATV